MARQIVRRMTCPSCQRTATVTLNRTDVVEEIPGSGRWAVDEYRCARLDPQPPEDEVLRALGLH